MVIRKPSPFPWKKGRLAKGLSSAKLTLAIEKLVWYSPSSRWGFNRELNWYFRFIGIFFNVAGETGWRCAGNTDSMISAVSCPCQKGRPGSLSNSSVLYIASVFGVIHEAEERKLTLFLFLSTFCSCHHSFFLFVCLVPLQWKWNLGNSWRGDGGSALLSSMILALKWVEICLRNSSCRDN